MTVSDAQATEASSATAKPIAKLCLSGLLFLILQLSLSAIMFSSPTVSNIQAPTWLSVSGRIYCLISIVGNEVAIEHSKVSRAAAIGSVKFFPLLYPTANPAKKLSSDTATAVVNIYTI